ncbi:MAG TPA: hypothetical protein ENN18_03795 [Proteobacteria bacterium]|nr:hypothetical protein [Pseudomonadota bacterium]
MKMINDLPDNWIVKPLGEVCKTIKGKKPKDSGPASNERTVPYINIKAFESGQPQEFAAPGDYPSCERNDVLIVWDGARAGLTGHGVSGYIGSTLAKVYSDAADSRYLFYFLCSQYDYINSRTKGVGIPHVDPLIFKNIPFPVPSLEQQRCIVAEIEKQFSRLDEAVANLKRVKANLKRYKAAVLKAAVEGKLSEKWRKAHPDVEPASELLERILAERRAKWEELELAKMRAMGKESKDDKWKSKYKEPTEPDTTRLNQLPEGWLWVRLEQATERITKGSSPNWQGFDYVEKGIPFVRSQNVLWGKLDVSAVAHLPKGFNEKEAKSVLQVGDVLLNIVGASIGRSAIVSKEVQGGNVNQAVAVIRLISGGLRNAFLMYYLVSANAQDQINQEKVDVARANISLSDIADLVAPLPPEQEQKKIMDEIARRLTITEKLELEIERNMKRAERLRQAIFKQAFRGCLAIENEAGATQWS